MEFGQVLDIFLKNCPLPDEKKKIAYMIMDVLQSLDAELQVALNHALKLHHKDLDQAYSQFMRMPPREVIKSSYQSGVVHCQEIVDTIMSKLRSDVGTVLTKEDVEAVQKGLTADVPSGG